MARSVRTWTENLAAATALTSELQHKLSAQPRDGLLANASSRITALSHDGRWWAHTISREESTGIALFDTQNGQMVGGEPRSAIGGVRQMEFSADSRRLITLHTHAEAERSWAQVWDTASLQRIGGELIQRDPEEGIAVFLDGAWLSADGSKAIATARSQLLIWDVGSSNPVPRSLRHLGSVHWATCSRDGRWLVTCSDNADRSGRIGWFWDLSKETNDGSPLAFEGKAEEAAFSPDSQWLIVSNPSSREEEERLASAMAPPGSAIYEPPFRRFRDPGMFTGLTVWNVSTRRAVSVSKADFGRVIHFHPFRDALLALPDHWTVQEFDLATGLPSGPTMKFPEQVYTARFSRDGRFVLVATANGFLHLRDATTGAEEGQALFVGENLRGANFSSDDRGFICIVGNSVRIVDSAPRRALSVILPHRPAKAFADRIAPRFSPDGRQVVTCPATNSIRLWDVETGAPTTSAILHDAAVRSIRFSSDGQWLLTISDTNMLTVWNCATGQQAGRRVWNAREILQAAFFRAPSDVVVLLRETEAEESIGVWNLASGTLLAAEFPFKDRYLAFARGLSRFALDSEGTVRVFDLTPAPMEIAVLDRALNLDDAVMDAEGRWLGGRTGERLDVWNLPQGQRSKTNLWMSEETRLRSFSPDGRWFQTSASDVVRLWDWNRAQPAGDTLPHTRFASAAPFSPDGRWIITIPKKTEVQLWETASTRPVSRTIAHPAEIREVEFSPDGKRFLTEASDGWARIWDAALPSASELLSELAEIIQDERLTEMGSLESIKRDWIGDPLGPIYAKLERQAPDIPEVRLIRWLLADVRTRTVSPFLKMTVPEYIDRLLENPTDSSRREARGLAIGNPALLDRLDQVRGAARAIKPAGQ